jgi:hypothetical protein
MPGIAHEGTVELVRRNPRLTITLLDSLGVPSPAGATAAMAAGELTSPLPAELRADAVVTLTGPDAKVAVAARALLEALMATGFKDDFVERYKAEGRAEGVAQGKAEDVAQGKASMVLRILAARGFDVPGKVREAVMSCTDLRQLDRWGEAAATAAALGDIFNRDR